MITRALSWLSDRLYSVLYTTETDSRYGSPVLVIRLHCQLDSASGSINALFAGLPPLKPSTFSALIINVNSAGGDLSTAQAICEWVKFHFTDNDIPVITVAEERCLSAALLILGCSPVRFSQPASMLGLFGVKFTWGDSENKSGAAKPMTTTKFKDINLSDLTPSTPKSEMIKEFLQDLHSQFEQALSTMPNMGNEAMDRLRDGQIISGKQAKNIGLVTHFGGMAGAIAHLRSEGHINEYAPDICYIGTAP